MPVPLGTLLNVTCIRHESPSSEASCSWKARSRTWSQKSNTIHRPSGKGSAPMPEANRNTRQVEMVVLMTPDMANFSGKVHGGALLNVLDRVAFACAMRYSNKYAVTLSVDQVVFRQAINVGELVTFLASINYVGKTSMEVGIRVEAEDIRTGTRRHTNSCYFTMVAVDGDGVPTQISALPPLTEVEERRARAAKLRRDLRVEFEQRFNAVGQH